MTVTKEMIEAAALELAKVPGFVLRDYWIDGRITNEAYLAELDRRSEAASTPTGVKVKALKWEKVSNQYGTQYRAQGIFGWLHYISNRDEDGHHFDGWHSILSTFDTIEAAKAAAQAYYEARVRSALSTPADSEPVGYLFEMRYESDRWSGTMFAEAINIPPEDVRNVRPLYAAPVADIEPVSEAMVLAACRAHTPQFDRLDTEIAKYAVEQMRSALTAALAAAPQPNPSKVDAEIERLRKALEPFSKAADRYANLVLGEDIDHWSCKAGDVTLGDLREARSALAKSPSSDRASSEADTSDFMHRLIENAFSWAMEDTNYLDPKATGRLIEATRSGMKPEEASEWRSDLPEILARKAALAAQGEKQP